MRYGILLTTVIGSALLSGCGDSILGPIDPDGVEVFMDVSGGFAGVDYTYEVDGESGEVRGLTCGNGCSFTPGQVLMRLSDAQVSDLAARLEDAGALTFDGLDFGTECCDRFEYTLSYVRDGNTATMSGTTSRMPAALAAAVGDLAGLINGQLPAIVRMESTPSDWPGDAYTLGQITLSGQQLTTTATYGGGCEIHTFDLVALGGWLESNPVQVNILITHDDHGDMCDALPTVELRYSLRPIVEAYEEAYGAGATGSRTLILRMADPEGGVARLVDFEF
jgi:hypothetical protein